VVARHISQVAEVVSETTDRIKSFIVDMFMMYSPILYILAYVIYDGKDDFTSTNVAPFIAISIYAIIDSIFISIKSQTPGNKAYDIYVLNDDGSKINFIKALIRFIMFLITASSIIGAFFIFYLKDKKTIYDLILKTKVVYK